MGKSRTDKPELILIAAKNWFPIKVVIEGKARRMTVMYFYKGEYITFFISQSLQPDSHQRPLLILLLKSWFPKMGDHLRVPISEL